MLPVPIQLNKQSSTPLYMQLAEQISHQINNELLKQKESLPSIRKLAKHLEVNNVTVVSAYKHLESKNLIQAKKGSGYFVSSIKLFNSQHVLEEQTVQLKADQINFASATPDPSIFPITAFKTYLNYILDRDQGYAFGYHETNGYEPLRESLADYLNRHHQLIVSPDNIQIVSGAQQGIDIIGKALLKSLDTIIVENPTYTGALAAFKSRNVLIKEVSLQDDGLNIEELERLLQEHQPKLLYLMTKFQNPTAISYSEKKMKQIINLAQQYDFYIVEDDSMSELCYDTYLNQPNFKTLDDSNRVIYIKSFSKLMMPGLRIGFIIVPPQLTTAIMNAKHHTDISSSGLIQRTVDLYLREGDWDQHIQQMRQIYQRKYKLMLGKLIELKKYGVSFIEPHGGLHFWLKLPKGISANELYATCKHHSLLIAPGSIFTNSEMDQYIRLSFASCNESQILHGVNILKETINKLQQTHSSNNFPLI